MTCQNYFVCIIFLILTEIENKRSLNGNPISPFLVYKVNVQLLIHNMLMPVQFSAQKLRVGDYIEIQLP